MAESIHSVAPQPAGLSVTLENRGDYAVFSVNGASSVEQAARWATAAITQAREQGVTKLLLDGTSLKGFPSPSLPDRYHFVREWTDAGRGMVRVVVVIPAEMIDRQKFGVKVALRSGLVVEVFTNEPEALAWLLQTKKTSSSSLSSASQ